MLPAMHYLLQAVKHRGLPASTNSLFIICNWNRPNQQVTGASLDSRHQESQKRTQPLVSSYSWKLLQTPQHCQWLPWHTLSQPYGTLISFPLAQTGEGISECELIQWFIKEGDAVKEFDRVCEVQSDKASIEITSRYTGFVRKLYHAKGDVVKVGAPLFDIEMDDGSPAQAAEPQAGAEHSGHATEPVTSASSSDTNTASSAGASTSSSTASRVDLPVHASPAVRHLAKSLGLDLSKVVGSGEGGRVTKDDVHRHAAEAGISVPSPAYTPVTPLATPLGPEPLAGATSPPAQPTNMDDGAATALQAALSAANAYAASHTAADQRLPIKGYRRAMVKSMTLAASIPHFHFCDEVQMDALMHLRATVKDDPVLKGSKLTYLPFIIKALSVALSQHPHVNSSLSADGSELLLHASHNVGIAMATPLGLVVPNIKQVQNKTITQISNELTALQQLAAAGKLPQTALSGGTITISNIGTIGGTYATPLVNSPESAIVALGRISRVPRYEGGSSSAHVSAKSIMTISWGADHRVVDGAGLAAFSNTWKSFLEEPGRLLLHLK